MFEVASSSNLAILYNDTHTLENHHCSRAFVVASETGLFAPLEEAERRRLRRLVIAAVLHTDMSEHRGLMARAGARAAAGAFAPAPYASDDATTHEGDEDDRSLLIALLVHAADCSNPLCPPAASARHAAALRKEFATQAGKEAALGLPISVAVPQEPDAQARAEQQFISALLGRLHNRPTHLILHFQQRSWRAPSSRFWPTSRRRWRCAATAWRPTTGRGRACSTRLRRLL